MNNVLSFLCKKGSISSPKTWKLFYIIFVLDLFYFVRGMYGEKSETLYYHQNICTRNCGNNSLFVAGSAGVAGVVGRVPATGCATGDIMWLLDEPNQPYEGN